MGLGALVLLVLANGFYVTGEFAVVAVDRSRIEQMAEDGDRRASSALEALRTLSFQLSGAQLGITVTSLLVGFLAEPALGRPLASLIGNALPDASARGVSVAAALALATGVQMVVGELIPKNLAIAKPLEITLAIATPFRIANAAMKPVIVVLNGAANRAVRALGIEPREELRALPTLDELQVLVESSREGGGLEEAEFALLARSMTFGEKTAADALMPRTAIEAIQEDRTLEDLGSLALDTGYSRFPVFGENLDDVVGVAHVKDIYGIEQADRPSTSVSAVMRPPHVIPLQRRLGPLLGEMLASREQLAIVIDEYGGTEGILTMEDLLEEIVGEIEDEHDPGGGSGEPEVELPAGARVLAGALHTREVEDVSGFRLPEGEYETLGGFLFARFGRIPEVGDHCEYQGWELKVVAMDGRRIDRVLVIGPSGEEPRP